MDGKRPTYQTLTCYQVRDTAPRIVAARAARQWMDDTDERFAYRCLPLSIANAMGWEILAPTRVTADWNGGDLIKDLVVEIDDPSWGNDRFASSHFGHGILTFRPGYLFRTEAGVGIWARGAPNRLKDGIGALDGIIETDWLDFTFTMNWQFTRPGRVTFDEGEPFCFITPVAYRALDRLTPQIVPIDDDPAVATRFRNWRDARTKFNQGLADNDPTAIKQKWQKWYTRGEAMGDGKPNPMHLSKLRLATPRSRTADAEPATPPPAEPTPDPDR